jgi:hypothetical protein
MSDCDPRRSGQTRQLEMNAVPPQTSGPSIAVVVLLVVVGASPTHPTPVRFNALSVQLQLRPASSIAAAANLAAGMNGGDCRLS